MSIHRINANIAAKNHAIVFGNDADSDLAAYYRDSDLCDWQLIDGAVVHNEYVETKRTDRDTRQAVKRNVRYDRTLAIQPKLNGHVRIGASDCSPVYNVTAITQGTTRTQLHLTRGDVTEVARPNYRTNDYRRR